MRHVRTLVAVGVAAVALVTLPGELAACSPLPDFPPAWARDLNQLALGSAALALATALLAVWRGRMTCLSWLPVLLFIVHPAWLVPPGANTCIDTATSFSQLSLFVSGGVVIALAAGALDERNRRRAVFGRAV